MEHPHAVATTAGSSGAVVSGINGSLSLTVVLCRVASDIENYWQALPEAVSMLYPLHGSELRHLPLPLASACRPQRGKPTKRRRPFSRLVGSSPNTSLVPQLILPLTAGSTVRALPYFACRVASGTKVLKHSELITCVSCDALHELDGSTSMACSKGHWQMKCKVARSTTDDSGLRSILSTRSMLLDFHSTPMSSMIFAGPMGNH